VKPGDVIVTPMPQADGQVKPRPAVVIAILAPYSDALVCGFTTQLRQEVAGFDEVMLPSDADFSGSGLKAPSVIRLGYLSVVMPHEVLFHIGSIPHGRLKRLLARLGRHFTDLANRIP